MFRRTSIKEIMSLEGAERSKRPMLNAQRPTGSRNSGEFLEPSPFTPLLSLAAVFQQKWQSKSLISPGTNQFHSLFDIQSNAAQNRAQFTVFCRVTDPRLIPF